MSFCFKGSHFLIGQPAFQNKNIPCQYFLHPMTIAQYLKNITKLYKSKKATEHSYRGDLQSLLTDLLSDEISVTNEPKQIKCGRIDYILTKKDIPKGFIEAKDIGDPDLEGKNKNKKQFDRYKNALQNLIFTDYLSFYFYRGKELTDKISIATLDPQGKIKPLPENFKRFEDRIKNFASENPQSITNPENLAKMMAGKSRLLADVIEQSLKSDKIGAVSNSELTQQKEAFEEHLIKDITNKQFADMYAQTITYGMFAARLNDDTPKTFSRIEAATLIPYSNPFLRKFFGHIAGIDIDSRIKWVVDDLVEIFLHSDVKKILTYYGSETQMEDPIIHFYEDFLAEYDPTLRKARGVWYTPAPVVKFIVRAVDDVLKSEFKLSDGLKDTSTTTVSITKKENGKDKPQQKKIHRVQILDPATGTGTFLAEVIRQIHQKFKGQEGIWSGYVADDLIPRLNGFELLMASYAMAHLQLDLLLEKTGFTSSAKLQRKNIFLTNSLGGNIKQAQFNFAKWLSEEAKQANRIKKETPVMCVIGNPPYSGISSNNSKWIKELIDEYKYVNGKHFNERKHWLNDDYVKFIRFGQYFIEENKSGVLAYINPHGFLDNPTFRGMRWRLLKTYDKIYTIDLHGNAKKKETAPDGSKDENVFDIMQGVSINIFIKTGKKKAGALGQVFHYDLYGKRKFKYDFLNGHTLQKIPFQKLPNVAPPYYFFVPKGFENKKAYEKGFALNELFVNNVTGIVSMADNFIFDKSPEKLLEKINDFLENDYSEEALRSKYQLGKNYAKWILENKNEIAKVDLTPVKIAYRPFDDCYTIFSNKLLWRWRIKTMQHFLKRDNLGLVSIRRSRNKEEWREIFVSNHMISGSTTISSLDINYSYPLYAYPKNNGQQTAFKIVRSPNFQEDIIKNFASGLGLRFTDEKEKSDNTFAPVDVLDYMYAVLHAPSYRKKYREFLKIDFPRVPYPTDTKNFWALVTLGGRLRKTHLLDFDKELMTTYPKSGDNKITRKLTKNNIGYQALSETNGRVWINDVQYFENVPLVAWEFFIGGYQPAQKWLKDRKDKTLSYTDILHYQKIILALFETDTLMKEIEGVNF